MLETRTKTMTFYSMGTEIPSGSWVPVPTSTPDDFSPPNQYSTRHHHTASVNFHSSRHPHPTHGPHIYSKICGDNDNIVDCPSVTLTHSVKVSKPVAARSAAVVSDIPI